MCISIWAICQGNISISVTWCNYFSPILAQQGHRTICDVTNNNIIVRFLRRASSWHAERSISQTSCSLYINKIKYVKCTTVSWTWRDAFRLAPKGYLFRFAVHSCNELSMLTVRGFYCRDLYDDWLAVKVWSANIYCEFWNRVPQNADVWT